MHNTLTKIFDRDYDSFFLIAGPCAVESKGVCEEVAGQMKEICSQLEIPYIFKSSYTKANRTRANSFDGIGHEHAIGILAHIRREFGVAVTTDIHESLDVVLVEDSIDLIQIPAYLCRQTNLLVAAGNSGKPVNIKKGQFMSGEGMLYAAEKVRSTGNEHVLLTERGNFFGYQDLVVDGRNIDFMSSVEVTVIDVTHATQRPNQSIGVSGGNPADVELMGRIGLSTGARGIFLEVHPAPHLAESDASSMIKLSEVTALLEKWKQLALAVRSIYG